MKMTLKNLPVTWLIVLSRVGILSAGELAVSPDGMTPQAADMGGVYTLGTSFGTCVSNNVICGISSFTYGEQVVLPHFGFR